VTEQEADILWLKRQIELLEAQIEVQAATIKDYKRFFEPLSLIDSVFKIVKTNAVWLGTVLVFILLYIDFERIARIVNLLYCN